jgi:hypothetical protein
MAGIEEEGPRGEPTSQQTQQHTPHEGGNGFPGLPPTIHERAKPPPESAQSNPPVENPSLTTRRGTVFECAIPEIIPSPFHIRRMLQNGSITKEEAQGLEQQWLEELKIMDRQSLEGEARWWEIIRDRFIDRQHQEEAQELEQQLEVIRKQLRQREGH